MVMKRACLLLFSLYSYSLFYYTFYGLSKSATEYFCVQRRPGEGVRTIVRQNLESLNITTPALNGVLKSFDGEFYIYDQGGEVAKKYNCSNGPCTLPYYSSYKNLGMNGSVWSLSYKIDKDYFDLSCQTHNPDIGMNDYDPKKFDVDTNTYTLDKDLYYKNLGVITFNISGYHDAFRLVCQLDTRTETCDIKESTQNNFFIVYLATASFLSMLIIGVNLGFCDEYLKRKIHFIRTLAGVDYFEALDFCNPITGKAYKVSQGDQVLHISNSSTECCHTLYSGGDHQFTQLSDRNGSYQIDGSHVHLTLKRGENETVHIGSEGSAALKKYFYLVWKNPGMCVMEADCKHYLTTEEVVRRLSKGEKFVRGEALQESWCLISSFYYESLKQTFILTQSRLRILMRHNENFFGSYNHEPLLRALSRQSSHFHRPSSVKNTQWKWYCSDISQFIKTVYGRKIFAQVTWKQSPAMKQAIKEEEGGLIAFDPDPVISVDPLNNEESFKVGYSLIGCFMPERPTCNLPNELNDTVSKAEEAVKKIAEEHGIRLDQPILSVKKRSEIEDLKSTTLKAYESVLDIYRTGLAGYKAALLKDEPVPTVGVEIPPIELGKINVKVEKEQRRAFSDCAKLTRDVAERSEISKKKSSELREKLVSEYWVKVASKSKANKESKMKKEGFVKACESLSNAVNHRFSTFNRFDALLEEIDERGNQGSGGAVCMTMKKFLDNKYDALVRNAPTISKGRRTPQTLRIKYKKQKKLRDYVCKGNFDDVYYRCLEAMSAKGKIMVINREPILDNRTPAAGGKRLFHTVYSLMKGVISGAIDLSIAGLDKRGRKFGLPRIDFTNLLT